MNWHCVAEKVYTKLLTLKQAFYKPDGNTAIFGVLPPEKSGIANFNARTYSINRRFHVYSQFRKYDYYKDAANNITKKNNFFPIDIFPIANSLFNYNKKIFVLGNSSHNIPYLKAAIEEKNKKNCFLFCHEVNLLGLLYTFLTFSDFKQIIKMLYPDYIHSHLQFDNLSFENINAIVRCGFRAILSLTNISNIIVNNDNAKQLLLEDIKNTVYEDTVSVTTVFLPIENINLKFNVQFPNMNFDYFKIGSFGACNNKDKATDIVIKSVALLNEEYGIKSKCILAGYDVDNYVLSQIPVKFHKYLLTFSNTSEDQLLSIMKQVDIAVQLRNYQYGESSGVICQLLGLNKRIIVSEDFMDERFESYGKVVPRFVCVDALAKVLYDSHNHHIGIDASVLFEKYGFSNLAEAILEI
jgi:hypothetical protein